MGSRHVVVGVALALFPTLGGCGEKFTAAPESGLVNDAGQGGSAGGAPDATPDVPTSAPPIPVDGLLLWLRADRDVALEGDAVVSWHDQSDEANDATQPAPVQRPRLTNPAIAGGASVDFDGSDDNLTLPIGFADFSAGLSIFAVALQRSSEAGCVSLVHLSNGKEVADISLGYSSGKVLYEVDESFQHGAELPLDVPLLWAVVHRVDSSFEVRLNRQPAGDGEFALPEPVERTQNSVGSTLYERCQVFPGQVAELLVYARGLGADELVAVEDYLARRAGL
jgi:hypothetical protein